MDGFKRRWHLGSFLKTIRKHLGHLPSVSTAKLTCLFHLLLWMHVPQGGSVSHPGSLQSSQFTGIIMTITVANTPWTCHVPSSLLHSLQRLTQLRCNFVKQILILSPFYKWGNWGWMRSCSQWEADMPTHPSSLAQLQIFLSPLFLSCSGLSPTSPECAQVAHVLHTACPLPGWPVSIFHFLLHLPCS